MLISIRTLSIALSLTLVIITIVICLSISLTTAQDALQQTKQAGADGIHDAFETASLNVQFLADSLMTQILHTSVVYVTSYLETQSRIVQSNVEYFTVMANTPLNNNNPQTPEFYDFGLLWKASRVFYGQMIGFPTNGIWVTNIMGQHVTVVGDSDTIGTNLKPELWIVINNGTDRDRAYPKATILGACDSSLQFLKKTFPCADGIDCPFLTSDENLYGACPASSSNVCPVYSRPSYDPLTQPYVPLAMSFTPEGSSWWTNVISMPPYVGIILVAPITSTLLNRKVGLTAIGVDLRLVTKFLRSLSLPNGSRIFIVEAINNPLLTEPTIGTMVGSSAGSYFTLYVDHTTNSSTRVPINCTTSNDSITSHACNWIFNSSSARQFEALNPDITYQATFDEQIHFVKTRVITVGNGLVWSIVLVIPRDTIMCNIDQQVAQTLRTINDKLDRTYQAREHGYLIMYMILAISGSVLILAALPLTHYIIGRPLRKLQDEMACVAHMQLEDIRKTSPSMVREIHCMQTSFWSMCDSLVEYRNFLPPSVLSQSVRRNMLAPREPPLCLMFTDIEGSTRLSQKHPEAMQRGLEIHHNVIRELIDEHNAYEVKTIGDSFMISAADVAVGVVLAARIQEKLLDADWPAELRETPGHGLGPSYVWKGLRVRIGIHYAVECTPLFDHVNHHYDYYGHDVNVTARVINHVAGGQIMMTQRTFNHLKSTPDFHKAEAVADFHEFDDHIELKGVDGWVSFVEVKPISLRDRDFSGDNVVSPFLSLGTIT
eukprot:PhF_6_TR36052/c0_g1_i1/m.52312